MKLTDQNNFEKEKKNLLEFKYLQRRWVDNGSIWISGTMFQMKKVARVDNVQTTMSW